MKKLWILGMVAVAALFQSCDNSLDAGGTASKALAGDWWVKHEIKLPDGSWKDESGYVLLSTYNTSANLANELFIDDHGQYWTYKVKCTVADPAAGTFGKKDDVFRNYAYLPESDGGGLYDIGLKVDEGKVLKGAATSPTGVKTDSICFNISFEDEVPAYSVTYRVSGYKRTGFKDDDH